MGAQHTLEQQLITFCEQNNLVHASLHVTRHGDGWMIYANVLSEGTEARVCGSSGYDTGAFAEALSEALTSLNRKRSPVGFTPIEAKP